MDRSLTRRAAVLGAERTGKTRILAHHHSNPTIPGEPPEPHPPTRGFVYYPRVLLNVGVGPARGDAGDEERVWEVSLALDEVGSRTHKEHLDRRLLAHVDAFVLCFRGSDRASYLAMWSAWWPYAVRCILAAQEQHRRPFVVFLDTDTYSDPGARRASCNAHARDMAAIMPPESFLFFDIDAAHAPDAASAVMFMWTRVAEQMVVQELAARADAAAARRASSRPPRWGPWRALGAAAAALRRCWRPAESSDEELLEKTV